MITVRTKGVPLTRELPIDEEGYAVFHLDESRFDAFDVLERTLAKVDDAGGSRPDRTAHDERFEAIMLSRKNKVSYALALASVRLGLKA